MRHTNLVEPTERSRSRYMERCHLNCEAGLSCNRGLASRGTLWVDKSGTTSVGFHSFESGRRTRPKHAGGGSTVCTNRARLRLRSGHTVGNCRRIGLHCCRELDGHARSTRKSNPSNPKLHPLSTIEVPLTADSLLPTPHSPLPASPCMRRPVIERIRPRLNNSAR